MSNLVNKINDHLSQRVQSCELSNDDIVSIIDTLGYYLNLKTISDYAKSENIVYNAVKKRIDTGKIKEYKLFGVTFIIDNE